MGKTLTITTTLPPHMGETLHSRMDSKQLIAFERVERERFLDDYFNGVYSEGDHPGKSHFKDWKDEWEPLVRERTTRGLEEGVKRFIRGTTPEVSSIYQADFGQLIYYDGLAEEVAKAVGELSFIDEQELSYERNVELASNVNLREIGFAQDVSEAYGHSLTNDSQKLEKR